MKAHLENCGCVTYLKEDEQGRLLEKITIHCEKHEKEISSVVRGKEQVNREVEKGS